MNSGNDTNYYAWPVDRLQDELRKLKENLRDLEETHAFTFGKTSVHIGAEQAQTMQEEFEEECARYCVEIGSIEAALKTKG